MTFRKIVEIATKMRESGDFSIDVTSLDPAEIYILSDMVKDDVMYEFLLKFQDIPIERMDALIQYNKAVEKLEKNK